jgi:hypothetical protein
MNVDPLLFYQSEKLATEFALSTKIERLNF